MILATSRRVRVLFLAFVGFGLIGTSSTLAQVEVSEVLNGSSFRLVRGSDVQIDGSGNVFVRGDENVLRVSPAGDIDEVLDASHDTPNNGPGSMALDAVGNLYVVDEIGTVIRVRMDRSTEVVASIGELLRGARDVEVDGEGNVYVAGAFSDNVVRVSPEGAVDEIIGPAGNGVEPLEFASGLAIDALGRVVVSGLASDNAFRFSGAGIELLVSSADGLDAASDIAADAFGNVYVAGRLSDNVLRIDAEGVVSEWVGPGGDGMRPLSRPARLHVSPAQELHIVTAGSVFDPPGTPRYVFAASPQGVVRHVFGGPGEGAPAAAAVAGSGSVFIAVFFTEPLPHPVYDSIDSPRLLEIDSVGGRHVRMDASGASVPYFGSDSVAADAKGSAYVAGRLSWDSYRIDRDGSVTQLIDAFGDGSSQLVRPEAIAVDRSGDVYVAGTLSRNVFRISPEGVITEIIDESGDGVGALRNPSDVAVDRLGNVYVPGFGSDNVFRISPDGKITEIADASGDGSNALELPRAVATDNDSNVYVACRRALFRVSLEDEVTQIIDANGNGTGPLGFLWDVAVAPGGVVYAADLDEDRVLRVDPTGAVSVVLDASGDGVHSLDRVRSIAADPGGNVYAVGAASANVFRVSPSGLVEQILDTTSGEHPFEFPWAIATAGTGSFYVTAVDEDVFFVPEPGSAAAVLSLLAVCLLGASRRRDGE